MTVLQMLMAYPTSLTLQSCHRLLYPSFVQRSMQRGTQRGVCSGKAVFVVQLHNIIDYTCVIASAYLQAFLCYAGGCALRHSAFGR